jgi:hypothetical protein
MADKPDRPGLEALLSTTPVLSPALEVTIHGQKVEVMFRELSQNLKERLRVQAIGWVEDQRRHVEKETGVEWRDVGIDLQELRADRWDLLLLHAAMRDPKTKEEACSLNWLEDRLGSEEHKFLASKYHEFELGLSPDRVTQEDIDLLIADLKKNAPDLVSLWRRYGFLTVYASLLYMVDQSQTSPIESSSDTP